MNNLDYADKIGAAFLKELADHKLLIIRDDGIYRHLRFKDPESYNYHFDLITWPGYLAYVGDVGSFTFRRDRDMLEFFHKPDGRRPDFSYWAQKLEAVDKVDGLKSFHGPDFVDWVIEEIRDIDTEDDSYGPWTDALKEEAIAWVKSEGVPDSVEEADSLVTGLGHEVDAGWIGEGLSLPGIFKDHCDWPSCQRYSDRFIMCCYGLQLVAGLYFEQKNKEPEHG